jgi:hypothetical protein
MSSSSSAPITKFSKLSLEGMAPTTRSQASQRGSSSQQQQSNESSSDPESGSDSSIVEDEPAFIRSPTKLLYKIDALLDDTRATVRDTFKDPPKIALQYCRLRDNVYAFQMTELKPLSIRIGSPDSNFPVPSCSCGKGGPGGSGPCKHLLWLLDQLVKQTLYDHDPSKPLTLTQEGYPEEIGDPFQGISAFRLDLLADGLHCDVITPDSEDDEGSLNPCRVREARELLAAVSSPSDGPPPEDYRPDIFASPTTGKKVIKRRDLECTVFRMLLANNEFFHYFLSLMRSSDPVNDPFRKLDQRAERVLSDLDAYSASGAARTSPSSSAEGPRDVPWAAHHLLGIVNLIKTAIFKRDQPLEAWERISAARALVHILGAVCDRNRDAHPGPNRLDRNLYLRLVGDKDRDFVIGVLNLLPDAAAQFVHNLEAISEQLGVHGAPASYVEKFRSLLSRLRSSASGSSGSGGAGSKRQGGNGDGQERGSKKRMK